MNVITAAPGMYLKDDDNSYHLVVAWVVVAERNDAGVSLDPITVTEINTGTAPTGDVTSLVPKEATVVR